MYVEFANSTQGGREARTFGFDLSPCLADLSIEGLVSSWLFWCGGALSLPISIGENTFNGDCRRFVRGQAVGCLHCVFAFSHGGSTYLKGAKKSKLNKRWAKVVSDILLLLFWSFAAAVVNHRKKPSARREVCQRQQDGTRICGSIVRVRRACVCVDTADGGKRGSWSTSRGLAPASVNAVKISQFVRSILFSRPLLSLSSVALAPIPHYYD